MQIKWTYCVREIPLCKERSNLGVKIPYIPAFAADIWYVFVKLRIAFLRDVTSPRLRGYSHPSKIDFSIFYLNL